MPSTKSRHWIPRLALVPLFLAFACDTPDEENDTDTDTDTDTLTELGQAREDFSELSAAHDDNYDYVSSRLATPEGEAAVIYMEPHCVWTTTLEVRDGVLQRREVEITEGQPGSECPSSFSEEGDSLGAEDSIHAAPALTLDEWYVLCEDEVADSENDLGGIPSPNVPYTLDEDGQLLSCGWQGADAGLVITGTPFFNLDSLTWID